MWNVRIGLTGEIGTLRNVDSMPVLELGVGVAARKLTPEQRKTDFLAGFMSLVDKGGTVEEIYDCLREAMLEATTPHRVPCSSTKSGFTYEQAPDHYIRVAAARVIAEITGLLPKAGGVQVNVGTDNSLHLSTQQQVIELASVGGVTPELLAEMEATIAQARAAAGGIPQGAARSVLPVSEQQTNGHGCVRAGMDEAKHTTPPA